VGSVMMRLMADLLRPHWRRVAVIASAMVVQVAMSLFVPWPLKVFLDSVVGVGAPPEWIQWLLPLLGGAGKVHVAAATGLVTVVIAAVTGVAFYVSNYVTESVGQRVANALRVRIFHRLQLFSLEFYDQNRVGTVLSTVMTDVQTAQNFASASMLNIITDTFTIVGMVCWMFWLRWDFVLIAVGVVPFLGILVWHVNSLIRAATQDIRTRQSDLSSALQQGLEGIEVVQAFDRQDLEERHVLRASEEAVAAWLRARRASSLLSPMVGLAVALCTGLVLWRRRLVVPERASARDPRQLRGEIVFELVAFGYTPEVPVLRDVSFRVEAGQTVGIVGSAGSGKSTIVSLVPRFRDSDAGRIQIDGVNVCDYELHPMRQQIGFVLQDTVLFRESMAENIAFDRPCQRRLKSHPFSTVQVLVHVATSRTD
jgi:ABC-type multidrug transport system fused ATPase/permease subunit